MSTIAVKSPDCDLMTPSDKLFSQVCCPKIQNRSSKKLQKRNANLIIKFASVKFRFKQKELIPWR